MRIQKDAASSVLFESDSRFVPGKNEPFFFNDPDFNQSSMHFEMTAVQRSTSVPTTLERGNFRDRVFFSTAASV